MKASKDLLKKHVKFLTTLRPYRNYQNLDSLEAVCDYLRHEFESFGLEVNEQKFIAGGQEYKNVIATYNGNKSRRLIVGAHFDVCGEQEGADDNASAVAGLIESARLVAEAKPLVDYRIDFAAFNLEEPPFYATQNMGSYQYAKWLKSTDADIIGLINYEMIGYFHDGPQPYPGSLAELAASFPSQANFIGVVGIPRYREFNTKVFELMRNRAEIDVQMIDDLRVEELAGMSDQRSFWKFGIPALMINDTSFVRNPNYHKSTDKMETLSFDHMAEVVTCAYRAVTGF
jgi:Zn-dependent M28 family amino/carboxypeptidase